jgi:hypothetical protein
MAATLEGILICGLTTGFASVFGDFRIFSAVCAICVVLTLFAEKSAVFNGTPAACPAKSEAG